MSLSDKEYKKLAGKFINVITREVVDDPKGDVLIYVGEWPTGNLGDRQSTCYFCSDLVGVSPKAWDIHQRSPQGNPLCCPFCHDVLWAIRDHCNQNALPGDIYEIGWDNVHALMVPWLRGDHDVTLEIARAFLAWTVH